MPDCAGGFVYEDRGDGCGKASAARNRLISWRSSGDVLELVETSLDWALSNNRIRFRFVDTPLLSGGVSIHETLHSVVVLVATVGSVHKMAFPHPKVLLKQHAGSRFSGGVGNDEEANKIPSVFSEATVNTAKENYHVLPSAGTGTDCPPPPTRQTT